MFHLHKSKLRAYARYRDDIYVITDLSFACTLMEFMRTKAQYFKIVMEVDAQDPQTFLDVEVVKRLTRYGCIRRMKDTTFNAPQLAESCRPDHVHNSILKN